MLLYNVTFRDDLANKLIPYVPYSTGDGENITTKRICLSDSIQNCIQAIGPCNADFHIGSTLIVRIADTAEMDSRCIVSPRSLWLHNLVPDALENKEYWYTKELPVAVKIYRVLQFDKDFDLSWTCLQRRDVSEIIASYSVDIDFYASPRSMYIDAIRILELEERYDDCDSLWERLAELPWAQCLRITNLCLEECSG